MPMTVLLLPTSHELVVGSDDARAAVFGDDPRHPGETSKILVVLDDHWSPSMRTEIVPADLKVQEWVPKVCKQIRDSSLLDAYGAVREVLIAHGTPEATADLVIEAAQAITNQPKIPRGWTAWGQIPAGSLSTDGAGRWLLVWPDNAGLAWFENVEGGPDGVTGPDRGYNPAKPEAAFVLVAKTGLTAEQIDAYLASPVEPGVAPPAVFERLALAGVAA